MILAKFLASSMPWHLLAIFVIGATVAGVTIYFAKRSTTLFDVIPGENDNEQ